MLMQVISQTPLSSGACMHAWAGVVRGSHHKEDDGYNASEHAKAGHRDPGDHQQLLAGGLGPDVRLRMKVSTERAAKDHGRTGR